MTPPAPPPRPEPGAPPPPWPGPTPEAPSRDVFIVSDLDAATVLLKDPRREILEMARSPITTVEMSERLADSRQRIGHHVKRLVEVGLLEEEEVGRRGAMVEKRYRASARRYALAPELLGPLAARLEGTGDGESLSFLLGALHEVQTDLRTVLADLPGSPSEVPSVPTLTLSSRLRFLTPAQRGEFADALMQALTAVVAQHAAVFETGEGHPAPGDPFRLTLTLHPTRP